MLLYRFFNPSAVGADRCVIIESASSWKALRAYVDRYHKNCGMVQVNKNFNRDNAIIMEVSFKKLNDGARVFHKIFALDIY